MRPIKPADYVVFLDYELEENYLSLKEGNWLKKALDKAIVRLKENVNCGEKIAKRLIPKDYIKKYDIDNLFWYQLPNAWRLVYSVVLSERNTTVMIIEYFNHKEYERRFGY